MGSFFAELKRRHIYRVAAAYAVVAWVLLQLFNNLQPIMKLPDWAGTLVLVFLVGGFPVVLLLAWVQHLAPADAASAPKTTRLDYIIVGALIVVIALASYEQLSRTPIGTGAQQATSAPSAAVPAGPISIAVLPFANLSGDASQEFFSDGMTEEITSALAKVSGLKVIGRTSAFQFKGQNQDLRAIGQALSAGYLIEGSVRKAGDQLRITAQLIKADDGTHVWSENYDRQLSNIFATQEDIAQAIATALRVPLGLQQGETLVSNRTANLESYQQYLRGKALVRNGFYPDAIKALEPVVASDPNFAPAWAYLARAYNSMPILDRAVRDGAIEEARRVVRSYTSKGEMAAREAIRLDPKLAAGYWSLATTMPAAGTFVAREELYRKALALDANDPDVLSAYSALIGNAGRLKEALPIRQQIRTVEPLVAILNVGNSFIARASGDSKTGISILEGSQLSDQVGGFFTHAYLAQAYAADGRFTTAADTLLSIPPTNLVSRQVIEEAARLIRQGPLKLAPETLPVWRDPLHWLYAYVGAPERMLENYERNLEIDYGSVSSQIWLPEFAPVRKTERFKALMRKTGLVEYWKARGWADLCHPVGVNDFECS